MIVQIPDTCGWGHASQLSINRVFTEWLDLIGYTRRAGLTASPNISPSTVAFFVDAHRDGKRFIVKADDLLTAFLFAGERRDSAKRC